MNQPTENLVNTHANGVINGYTRGTVLIAGLYVGFGGSLFAAGIAIVFGAEPLTAGGWALATFMAIGLLGWTGETLFGAALEAIAAERAQAAAAAAAEEAAAKSPEMGGHLDVTLPEEPGRPAVAAAAYSHAAQLGTPPPAAAALPVAGREQANAAAAARQETVPREAETSEFVELGRVVPPAGQTQPAVTSARRR